MAKQPPDRISVSFPEDSPLDSETIDELVEQSECETRSEWIRKRLAESSELEE